MVQLPVVGHLFAKLMYLPPIRGLGMFVRVYEVEMNPGLVGMPSETVTGLLHSTFKPDEPVTSPDVPSLQKGPVVRHCPLFLKPHNMPLLPA